jgi:beta-glucosidase
MRRISENSKEYARECATRLLTKMTLQEKIGQVNQRLYGFGIYTIERNARGEEEIVLSEEFKQEVKKCGGLGVLYGLYRADPWSKRDEKTGLVGSLATKAYNQVQRYVMEHSRLGIPMLLSSECPHGHQALHGYLLPVNLTMGATFHPELIEQAYHVCGKQLWEMGVDMALVSTLDILRDPRWGRSEECYSEDPYLASELAKAAVKGIQSEGVAVVAKHFCGQGEGTGGVNASAARIGERELREIHLPAMKACCEENVQGVMAAYNEIDGLPCHANRKLLTDILRDEMGFQGVVMADGIAIDQLDVMTGDNVRSAALALQSGVDIGLWDEAFGKLEQAIEENPDLEKELDRAVLNVLSMKYERGLFEHPFIEEDDHYTTYDYNNYEESLQIARESVVLLENREQILPLSLDKLSSIAVIGPNSDELYHQLGDYTPSVNEKDGVTVLQGIRKSVETYEQATGRKVEVKFQKGCALIDTAEDEIEKAVEIALASDVAILVLGGSSSRFGDVTFRSNGAAESGKVTMDCGEGVDTSTLELPGLQNRLAEALISKGIPTIVVSIQGRPYAMENIARKANALLCSFYPGMKGGQAIAEILFGKISPSGCLPASIPRHVGQLPVYYNFKSSYRGMDYYDCEDKPLYSFGYGQTYTSFDYENFQIGLIERCSGSGDKASVDTFVSDNEKVFNREMLEKCDIGIQFTIKNNGDMDAFSVPQLYIRQEQSNTIRRIKELKAFDKVWITQGEYRTCLLTLSKEKLSVWNENMDFVVEASPFQLIICDGNGEVWKDTIKLGNCSE